MVSSSSGAVAYAGSPPGNLPVKNAFAFAFSQPFQTVSDFVPREHQLRRIEAERPIFVDNTSGRCSRQQQLQSAECSARVVEVERAFLPRACYTTCRFPSIGRRVSKGQ